MGVYDLTGLPYAEQLCWYKHRCSTHAGNDAAADHTRTEWEPFDPSAPPPVHPRPAPNP